MSAIKAVRSRRAEMNVPPSKKAHLTIVTDRMPVFEGGKNFLSKLAYAGEVTVTDIAPENVDGLVSVVTNEAKMYMPMAELVDLEKERARIEKELKKAQDDLVKTEAKLQNQNFVSRAPEAVVNVEREKVAKAKALIENLTQALEALK